MSILNESSLLSDVITGSPKKPNNNWYDRVYLCWEDTDFKQPKTSAPIKGFKCYKYDSFENADFDWNKKLQEYHKMNIRHTMIPICKWVPSILDKYILDWKLKKMYWLGNHFIGSVYNVYCHKK